MSSGRVIKFLDHSILPATPKKGLSRPRIIESGLVGEGKLDPSSPHVTAADGIATLFYKLGQEKWIEKMLDADNVYSFDFFHKDDPHLPPLYCERNDHLIEIGTFGEVDGWSVRAPGIAYGIEENGNWLLVSTSDNDDFSQEPEWMNALSEYLGRSIINDKRWERGIIKKISWSGITEEEKRDNMVFTKNFTGGKADSESEDEAMD